MALTDAYLSKKYQNSQLKKERKGKGLDWKIMKFGLLTVGKQVRQRAWNWKKGKFKVKFDFAWEEINWWLEVFYKQIKIKQY